MSNSDGFNVVALGVEQSHFVALGVEQCHFVAKFIFNRALHKAIYLECLSLLSICSHSNGKKLVEVDPPAPLEG